MESSKYDQEIIIEKTKRV